MRGWRLTAVSLRVALVLVAYAAALFTASILCSAYFIFSMPSLVGRIHPVGDAIATVLLVAYLGLLFSGVPAAAFLVVAEWKRVRAFGYYILAGAVTGGLAGEMQRGFLPGGMFTLDIDYLLPLGIVVGGVAGSVYWRIAGRRAGRGSAIAAHNDLTQPSQVRSESDGNSR